MARLEVKANTAVFSHTGILKITYYMVALLSVVMGIDDNTYKTAMVGK